MKLALYGEYYPEKTVDILTKYFQFSKNTMPKLSSK